MQRQAGETNILATLIAINLSCSSRCLFLLSKERSLHLQNDIFHALEAIFARHGMIFDFQELAQKTLINSLKKFTKTATLSLLFYITANKDYPPPSLFHAFIQALFNLSLFCLRQKHISEQNLNYFKVTYYPPFK